MTVVLDASAVLAVLQGENGQHLVLPHLQRGIISAVNYSEILKKAAEHGSELERTRHFLATFSLIVTPFDEQQAVAAARLWPMSRQLGLSFADRACLALGESLSAEVLTADTRMGMAELPVTVTVIR